MCVFVCVFVLHLLVQLMICAGGLFLILLLIARLTIAVNDSPKWLHCLTSGGWEKAYVCGCVRARVCV